MNDLIECQACTRALGNPGRGGVYCMTCSECRARLLANSPEAFAALRGEPGPLQASIAEGWPKDFQAGRAAVWRWMERIKEWKAQP